MRDSVSGIPLYRWCGSVRAVLTRGWKLPGCEKWFLVDRGRYRLLMHWLPHHGVRLAAEYLRDAYPTPLRSFDLEEYKMAIKKRDPMAGPRGAAQGPSAVSVILAKLPALREFLSCTTYEGGSMRTVGNMRVASQGRLWEITLQDPDALARLTVRDESLDKALMLLEQLLGVEEAPWETDRWLVERSTKNQKKKP